METTSKNSVKWFWIISFFLIATLTLNAAASEANVAEKEIEFSTDEFSFGLESDSGCKMPLSPSLTGQTLPSLPTDSSLSCDSATMARFSSTTTLYTTDGTEVTAKLYSEASADEIRRVQAYMAATFPYAIEIDAPTALYNCHSYAWYMSSTDNTYWIDDPSAFITDSHTQRIEYNVPEDISNLHVWDIITYWRDGKCEHSGLIISLANNTIRCRSKWGGYGLYEHDYNYVPEEYTDGTGNSVDIKIYRYAQGVHTLRYTSLGTSHHRVFCLLCNYSYNESHTPNAQGTKCIKCKANGPFIIPVLRLWEEETA